MHRTFVYATAAVTLALSAPAHADHHGDAAAATQSANHAALLAAAANGNRKDDSARDQYRHPVETLEFFQVAPDMKVGEYAPGGGWYSRMLGDYLNADGKLVGLFFTPENGVFDEKTRTAIREAAAGFPAKVEEWTGRPAAQTSGLTLDQIGDADKGSLDRILVIRMLHNMMRWNFADSELKALRELLKDDGLLGIVQHRARPDAPYAYTDGNNGYLREEDVIRLVELEGFELVGKSEVNANPRDTADHVGGVWQIPPAWASKDEAKKAIGESDRMTLLFRKRK